MKRSKKQRKRLRRQARRHGVPVEKLLDREGRRAGVAKRSRPAIVTDDDRGGSDRWGMP